MGPLGHALLGVALTLMTRRALDQQWLADEIQDPWALAAIRFGIPFVVVAGSALAFAAGRISGDYRRSLRWDAITAVAPFLAVFALAVGHQSRDVVGLVYVAVVASRILPWAWWAVRSVAHPAYVFAVCFAFYAAFVGWRAAASLPLGDQVFYLLSTDRLAHGSLDATIDPKRFFEILGIPPASVDSATHVALMPAGPRLIQGYAMPALLLPGWLAGGEVGATLVIALFAAWTAMQTWLLVNETAPSSSLARGAWLLSSFCAPLALAAVHIFPNAVGAALVVTGYRYAFTARVRRPALAGALLGATTFLNPRDGLILVVLAAFVFLWERRSRLPFALGVIAVTLVSALVSFITFGIPVPYAGYFFGTGQAQTLDPEPTWWFRFWIGLPAILFDRVFGVAGTAPWILLGALGIAPALRAAGARLLPGLAVIVASIGLLSLFRLWEGGYAPANRYLVDVLPLAVPFVAYALVAARSLVMRGLVAVIAGASALATAFLLAVPSAALNTAFEDKPQALLESALGIDPLGWLPSFQPVTPDWWIGAYLRLIPAVAIVAWLAWLGLRKMRA